MIDFLKSVDVWFLVLAVLALGWWFKWSVGKLFANLENSITALHDLIEKLFSKNDNHESRISALEGRCQAMACEPPTARKEANGH